MTARASRPHAIQSIRWGDMDALGHVNNTVYFRYMEQARIEWLYAQSVAARYGERAGTGDRERELHFLMPLVYPGDVEVRMYLGEPGRRASELLRDRRGGDDVCRRRGEDRVDRSRVGPADAAARP